ncbi:MAG: DUF697 domain-containing protein [Sneathiellaceae bacterium]
MSVAEDASDGAEEAAPAIDHARVAEIIRNHSYAAAAGGLIPVPALDIVVATTAQLRMIAKLSDIYGVRFSEQAVKSAISSLLATVVPPALIGYPALSLAKSVPVVGQLLGIATLPAINGVVTWALGRSFAWHFARGGSFDNLKPADLADKFKQELKAGKAAMSGSRRAAADGTAPDADPATS